MREKSTVKKMPFVFFSSVLAMFQYSVLNISSVKPDLRRVHREFHNLNSAHLKWAIQLQKELFGRLSNVF